MQEARIPQPTYGQRLAAVGALLGACPEIKPMAGRWSEWWRKSIDDKEREPIDALYHCVSAIRDGSAGAAFATFLFGRIEWMNYRASNNNSTTAIATDKVTFFANPPGLFESSRSASSWSLSAFSARSCRSLTAMGMLGER